MKNSSTHPELNVVAPTFVPDELWKGVWGKQLRRPVARATYVATAMQLGIWEPVRLEKELLKRSGSYQHPERKLRRLRDGTPARKPGVIQISHALGGDMVVPYWANHPIFHLLDLDVHSPYFDLTILYSVNSISGPLRRYMWPREQATSAGSVDAHRAQIPDTSTLRAAFMDRNEADGLSEIDWLTLSLVTYVLAKRSRDDELAHEAAFVTCSAFDYAVMLQPPLLAAWRDLANVMADRVWDPSGLSGIFRPGGKRVPMNLQFFMDKGVLSLPDELLALASAE